MATYSGSDKRIKYLFESGGSGGSSSLAGLSDVNLSSPTDGQVLTYDNGEWVNAAGGSGGGGVHYSTTEQVIGTWIDGKTLYEKTVMLGTRITISYDYTTILADMSSDNIESLIDAVVFDNNGGTDYNLVRLVVGCVDIMLGGDKKLYANIIAGALERKMTGYTIRYTKTTT